MPLRRRRPTRFPRIDFDQERRREQRVRVYRRDGFECQHCGHTAADPGPNWTGRGGLGLTLDHVIARSVGGSHADINLQVLCVPCNSSKGVRPNRRPA